MSKFCLKHIAGYFLFILVFVLFFVPVSAFANVSFSSSFLSTSQYLSTLGMSCADSSHSIFFYNVAVSDLSVANYSCSSDFSSLPASWAAWGAPSTIYVIEVPPAGYALCSSYAACSFAYFSDHTFSLTLSATPLPTPGGPTATPTPTTAPSQPTNTLPTPGGPTATPTPTTAPGQPTNTLAPTSSSSQTSSTSITYYPSVNLTAYSPDPTNKSTLSFSGAISLKQGTIELAEYTLTDGANWLPAQLSNGNFTFTTSNLAEGVHTIRVRAKSTAGVYTKSESYASDTITIVTTPPTVILDEFPQNSTNNLTPTISGNVIPHLGNVTRIEVSLDNGRTWIPVRQVSGRFQLTAEKLEDGNYQIIARAFDNAGNIGRSAPQALVVDTIPPIIGGGMQALGPQILTPNDKGSISVVAGAETTIAISMKGGVTEAEVQTTDGVFKLYPQEGTNMWVGKIKFENAGEKLLTISAIDGANNKTERPFNTLLVERFGRIEEKDTKQVITNAEVSLYYFETITQQWVLWEGKSYGQENPQKTDNKGSYSFMVPAGKYYIEVMASGYHTAQSEILTLSGTSVLNFNFPLRSKPKLTFVLPIIGEIILTMPTLSPPDTISTPLNANHVTTKRTTSPIVGSLAPQFTLPNLDSKDVSLASYKGKKMVLTFLSPWSSLSLEQASFLSSFSDTLPDNMGMLAISLQESQASTQTFMQRGNYSFPIVVDKDGKTATDYNVTILPQHYFIDSKGAIQEIYTGVLTQEELFKKLENML